MKVKKLTPDDLEKMDPTVRLLWETMQLKDLTPEKAAPFIGCSTRQIYRWLEGDKPRPIYKKAIQAGIRKIDSEILGDTKEGLVSWVTGDSI